MLSLRRMEFGNFIQGNPVRGGVWVSLQVEVVLPLPPLVCVGGFWGEADPYFTSFP